LFLDFGPIRASFECEIPELPGDHPGQPHMVRIPPLEPGDEIFLGWWHAEPPPPATKPNIIFTRTPEDDDGY
jgi:hypothetical protein